jgi:hypothetical protein
MGVGNVSKESFENVKNQIGYCGIWCGSCVAGNGALRELSGRFADTVDAYGLQGWAPSTFDFDEFYKGLQAIEGMPLCEGCVKGDGAPDCTIRACALDRGVEDCVECGQLNDCGNSDRIAKMRTGAINAGLFVKDESEDREALLERWTEELKSSWPSCILFIGH